MIQLTAAGHSYGSHRIVYNALIGAVPGMGLNAGLIFVNLWPLRSLPRGLAAAGHPGDTDQDDAGADVQHV
jgi:hypothetical protein